MQPPQKKTLLQRWKESIGEWPLLGKIVAWVVLAILAFAAVMCCLWHLTSEPGKYVASIAATSLTIVGGVGAVAYLVIKYQERQQAGRDEERAKREERREEDRLVNTKMQDAVDQLGSDRASTRIAGVYALTDVADTYGGGYRQRVVDILCGYLRSDRRRIPSEQTASRRRTSPGLATPTRPWNPPSLLSCATIFSKDEKTTTEKSACSKSYVMTSCGATARSTSMELLFTRA